MKVISKLIKIITPNLHYHRGFQFLKSILNGDIYQTLSKSEFRMKMMDVNVIWLEDNTLIND